jgi:hypothetical protein
MRPGAELACHLLCFQHDVMTKWKLKTKPGEYTYLLGFRSLVSIIKLSTDPETLLGMKTGNEARKQASLLYVCVVTTI